MKNEIKRLVARNMANELWDKYMKSTEPSKRHIYALRYAFWAGIRDKHDPEINKEATCER